MRKALLIVLAAPMLLVGCDDGPDVSRPAEGLQGDPVQLAEFCEKLTSQQSIAPTNAAAASDAVAYLDDLLTSTPASLRDEVTRLRDAAAALAAARDDAEAERIARDRFSGDVGLFTAYTTLDTVRRDACEQ